MTGDIFVPWLRWLDTELTQPTLFLLESAGAHIHIDKLPWTHLCIQRLPSNSTPVTEPLDDDVISAFKRAYLEILGRETYYARNFEPNANITNGITWTQILGAWDEIEPSTLCATVSPKLLFFQQKCARCSGNNSQPRMSSSQNLSTLRAENTKSRAGEIAYPTYHRRY